MCGDVCAKGRLLAKRPEGEGQGLKGGGGEEGYGLFSFKENLNFYADKKVDRSSVNWLITAKNVYCAY